MRRCRRWRFQKSRRSPSRTSNAATSSLPPRSKTDRRLSITLRARRRCRCSSSGTIRRSTRLPISTPTCSSSRIRNRCSRRSAPARWRSSRTDFPRPTAAVRTLRDLQRRLAHIPPHGAWARLPALVAGALSRMVFRPRRAVEIRRSEVPRRLAKPLRRRPRGPAQRGERRVVEPGELRDDGTGRPGVCRRPAAAVLSLSPPETAAEVVVRDRLRPARCTPEPGPERRRLHPYCRLLDDKASEVTALLKIASGELRPILALPGGCLSWRHWPTSRRAI